MTEVSTWPIPGLQCYIISRPGTYVVVLLLGLYCKGVNSIILNWGEKKLLLGKNNRLASMYVVV